MWPLTALVITLSLLLCAVSRPASQTPPNRSKQSREVAEIRAEFERERTAQNTWLRILNAAKRGRWKDAQGLVGSEVKFSALVQRWQERSLLLRDITQLRDSSALSIVALPDRPMERYAADSIIVEVLGKLDGVDSAKKEIRLRARRVRVTAD